MVSTPGWLMRAAGVIVALALVAGGIVLAASGGIVDAARTIGRDAEPSVALALGMTSTLADMNAAALGDSLTDAGAASGTSRAFRTGAATLAAALVEAARNITYGDAEAEPLRRLQQALLAYEEAVVESRYIGAGDPWITSRRVQWASRVNRDFAAPAAQEVANANATVLEVRWARYQARWLAGAIAGVVALGLLTGATVIVQLWLLRRTRRLVNPPLAAATVICAALSVWYAASVFGAHATLRIAKEDAYDSLHVLFAAKAVVSTMQADTALALLDPALQSEAQQRVAQSEQALLGDAGTDPVQARALAGALRIALATERQGDASRALAQVPKTGGWLGTELANITFGVPERTAATAAVEALLSADALIRSIQDQALRERPAAITRWLEDRPGGGTPAFAAVQAALDRTIAVNQSEFDRTTAAMLRTGDLIAPITLAALALTILLSVGGLWLRLREYR